MHKREFWPYWTVVCLMVLWVAACPPARGQQFSVTFRSLELRVSEAMVGSREYGLWTAEVKQLDPAGGSITRKDILDAGTLGGNPLPFIADDDLARDLIQNRVYLSGPAKFGRALSATKSLAGPGLAAAGLADVPNVGWIGVGLLAVDLVMFLSKGREPKPEDIIEKLLPKEITLAYRSSGTYTILSAKVRGARVVKAEVVLSVRAATEPSGVDHIPATEEIAAERLAKILMAREVSWGRPQ